MQDKIIKKVMSEMGRRSWQKKPQTSQEMRRRVNKRWAKKLSTSKLKSA